MAQRVSPVAIPAPVAELVEAWNDRSADRFAAALAHDAQISVPPLHLELRGRDEAWDGVARLFGAFGALRYTSRHRYLTPDTVTDEALLEGLQTRDFLGAPPAGRPGAVAARVMIRHDGRQVTALTVWPDVAALRQLSAGMARRIDLRSTDPAAPVVAALRATIPATEGKLSVGQERQSTQVATPEGATLLPGAPPAEDAAPELRSTTAKGKGKRKDSKGEDGTGKDGKDGKDKAAPKPPLSRKARRLRGIAAGVLMLGVAGALGAYVVQGVKGAKTTVASAAPSAKHKPSPTGKGSRGAASSGSSSAKSGSASGAGSGSSSSTPSSKPTFDPKTNTYTLPNTVLFETDSATLRKEAVATLDQVVTVLVTERRYGVVRITGYTDDTGPSAYNLRLSSERALTVKQYLVARLPSPRFTVSAIGKGESGNVASNRTAAGREKNRRVQIHVPDPSA